MVKCGRKCGKYPKDYVSLMVTFSSMVFLLENPLVFMSIKSLRGKTSYGIMGGMKL